MPPDREAQRAWARQWQSAGVALAAQRRHELRTLSDEAALAASETLLSLALMVPLPPARGSGSGLVRQQALLHRRPR